MTACIISIFAVARIAREEGLIVRDALHYFRKEFTGAWNDHEVRRYFRNERNYWVCDAADSSAYEFQDREAA